MKDINSEAIVMAKQVLNALNYSKPYVPLLVTKIAKEINISLAPLILELDTLRCAVNNPAPKYDWSNIPAEYRWAATDKNGRVFAYTDRPEKYVQFNNWNDRLKDSTKYVELRSPHMTEYADWENSLEARPSSSSEPTDLDLTQPLTRIGIEGTFEFIRKVSSGYLLIHTLDDCTYSVVEESLKSFINIDEYSTFVYLVEDSITHDRFITHIEPYDASSYNIISKLFIAYNIKTGWKADLNGAKVS